MLMTTQPDNTALRTALWRALHVLADREPHLLEDKVGYDLIRPEKDWQDRPDMKYTKRLRAAVVARARFIEDVAKAQIEKGVRQYVLLGAGLDSFAQRNTEICSGVDIYEIDQPGTLAWKEEKLTRHGYGIPANLHFVPVDFENSSWWASLLNAGFDLHKRAVISCTGVTLYLSKDSVTAVLKRMALLASGSTLAVAFYLPIAQLDEEDRPMQEIANKGAAASGTPFVSFFSMEEVVTLAGQIGLKEARILSTREMTEKYFKGRPDHLVPASGEFFLVAGT